MRQTDFGRTAHAESCGTATEYIFSQNATTWIAHVGVGPENQVAVGQKIGAGAAPSPAAAPRPCRGGNAMTESAHGAQSHRRAPPAGSPDAPESRRCPRDRVESQFPFECRWRFPAPAAISHGVRPILFSTPPARYRENKFSPCVPAHHVHSRCPPRFRHAGFRQPFQLDLQRYSTD